VLPSDGSARPLRREAAVTAAVAAVVVVALWLVFIRFEPGRQFENAVWESRTVLALELRLGHDSALRFVDETTIALALLVVVAIGLVRRRLFLGVAVTVAVAGATVTTQVLERWVITRPPTVGELARISGNSFPSGHATICTALGLAALVMIRAAGVGSARCSWRSGWSCRRSASWPRADIDRATRSPGSPWRSVGWRQRCGSSPAPGGWSPTTAT